ncbi:MAG: sn-glycerol-1-phosphate dehydrogenase [Elusimicrobiota bacterium]
MDKQLQGLLGKTIKCPCGKSHSIPTKDIIFGEYTLYSIASLTYKYFPKNTGITLIADKRTYALAGDALISALSYNSSSGWVDTIIVPDKKKYGQPKVDDETIDYVLRRTRSKYIISLGAGSINDISKSVATKIKGIYITIPTAPSMNGYTSSISAITSNGLKITTPAVPPVAVLCDTAILSSAPKDLILAGLADLMSKPVCGTDWKLSHIMTNEYWCALPGKIVEHAEKQCRAVAKDIGKGNPSAVATLTEGLLLSGMSMTIAGSSAPASGGEHLISHYWDITADHEKRLPNLHGRQVGVATILTGKLYAYLKNINPKSINIANLTAQHPDWPARVKELRKLHTYLAPQIIPEVEKKFCTKENQAARLFFIKTNWSNIWQQLNKTLLPWQVTEKTLRTAGAPVRAKQLGLSGKKLEHTLLSAKDMRARYTVLDLASDLGVLNKFIKETR